MKVLKFEIQTNVVSTLYKLIFVASLLLISVFLEKWQNF